MKITLSLFLLLQCFHCFSQNVGIGTNTPAQKLDVNGNINVTGSILADGTDGTAGQVLMKNQAGDLAWGAGSCTYKNQVRFASSGTWTVPAGVTEILVELWGAGGGGNVFCGGGGGGYFMAVLKVTAGQSLNITVGTGGLQNSPTASAGGFSRINSGPFGTCTAYGGTGAIFNNTTRQNTSAGGDYNNSLSNTYLISSFGLNGKPGKLVDIAVFTTSSKTVIETKNSNGGDAANTSGTGGIGGYVLINAAVDYDKIQVLPTVARLPGGGGAGGGSIGVFIGETVSSAPAGTSGANGFVSIWY